MKEHRFILEPYKGMNTRHHCPGCKSKDKTYSLYIDTETGQHINAAVGRCNRESNCGYHVTPKQYFADNNIRSETVQQLASRKPISREPSFIDTELFKQSLKGYDNNNFVKFLISLFGERITGELIEKYFIGTSKHWPESTTFWQIDSKGKIRDGKIIQYNAIAEIKSIIGIDCKRNKINYPPVQWVHSVTNQPNFQLKQCLFGEHLLTDKIKPVAIVESEKTAIISTIYLPQFIWLAVGSLTNLSIEKCLILADRKVILYPDLNGFVKWTAKAKELTKQIPGLHFEISDLLEKSATEEERENGLDLADYLIRFDWREFRKETIPPLVEKIEGSKKNEKGENSEPPENNYFFSNPAQSALMASEEAVNWFNGHLFPSMNKTDIFENLHF